MKVFRKATTVQKLEHHIVQLAKQAERLANRRVAAQQALDNAVKVRQQALMAGDDIEDARLAKLQAAVSDASSLLQGIDDALAMLAQQKAESEAALVKERDRAERVKVSEEINAAVNSIETRIEPMLSGMRELGKALTAIDHLSFEVGQLGQYLSGVSGEAEVALAFVVPDARRLADAVKGGNAAIPRRPKAPPVPVPEPVAPTMTVFMLRSANYRDETGRTRFAGQYEDAMMPVPTAQRALRHGVAVSVADPRRAQLRGARGGDFNPLAPDVVDLDAIEEPKGVPYVGSDPALAEAHFTEIDRSGEARTIQIAVPRV
jgi:hypothetical protein